MRLFIFGLSAATILSAQYNYYVPEMVDGNAVAHNERARARSRFLNLRTTFVLINSGKTDANVTIAASHDDASPRHLNIPGLGSGASIAAKVPAGGTRLFSTDGSGDGTGGAAVVTSDSQIEVSEILSNTASGDPLSESSVAALGDSDLMTEYLIPVDTAGLDTGAAMFNPGPGAATITLSLLDGTGKQNKVGEGGAQRETPDGYVRRRFIT